MTTQKSFFSWGMIFDEQYVVLSLKFTNVSSTFIIVSKLEIDPLLLMEDQAYLLL